MFDYWADCIHKCHQRFELGARNEEDKKCAANVSRSRGREGMLG